MSALGNMTEEQLTQVLLTFAMTNLGSEIGAVRLARLLLAAGLKLASDVEGEEKAWELMRELLVLAVERTRSARPAPKLVR